MENISDIRINKISDIVDEYIQCIKSIRETLRNSLPLLQKLDQEAKKSLRKFIGKYDKDILKSISPSQIKELKAIIRNAERADLAVILFPQSMLVSLVSQYDNLIGQLVHFIYDINPNLLNESNSQISYKELFAFHDIDAIKNNIIQGKIETILRKSHEEQIDDLQKLSGVKNLKGVSFWKDFIEITQRRNLLVHCKGCVSDQYIKVCKNAGMTSLPSKGDYLSVDEYYFNRAYFVFYTMGVLLSQVLTRQLLENEKLVGEIDTVLTNIIYETLEDGEYDLTIELSNFALGKDTEHACRLDEVYFVLNFAQAYKWQGNQQKCNEILSNFDFSAMTPDILVAKFALEDDVNEVVKQMKKVGDDSKIMTKVAYASWVIFKDMRERKEFKETYKEIFGEDLTQNILTPEENKVFQEFESEIEN